MTPSFSAGWRQVGICFVLLVSTGMIAATYGIIAVPLEAEFKPSRMVLMLTMTVLSGVSALIAPMLGSMMDRVSLRIMTSIGAVLLACGYFALSFATSFDQVLIAFGLLMAPANVLIGPVATTTLLSRWFVRKRGMAIGIAIAGVATGSIVYPIIIQGLLNGHDWREAMRLLSLVLLLTTLPAALLVINRPSDRGLHPDGAEIDPAQAAAGRPAGRVSAWDILSDPTFWLACFLFAVVTAGMKGMVTNLSPMAVDVGVKASDAAYLVTLYGTCGFVAKFSFAALADRVGPRLLMFTSLVGFAAGMATLTQASSGYAAIALGTGLIGLFGGLMVPLQSLVVPRIFGSESTGRAMGLISSVTLLALMSTPPLFGMIRDLYDSYSAIFVTFALLALITMAIVPAIRLHPRRHGENAAATA